MLDKMDSLRLEADSMVILAANAFLFAALFTIAYKKCGLE